MNNFTLHPRLAEDTALIGDLPLCRVLLMNDRRFPWLILVPRRDGARELFDLSAEDYRLAMEEVRAVSQALGKLMKADKMNVAALGNIVPQLHIHIIARSRSDIAWPQPVWSVGGAEPYSAAEKSAMVNELKAIPNITKM